MGYDKRRMLVCGNSICYQHIENQNPPDSDVLLNIY